MWRWSPTKFSNRTWLIIKLVLLVILGHAIVFFMCSRRAAVNPMSVRVTAQGLSADMPIIIMPFVKRTGQLDRLAQGRVHARGVASAGRSERVRARRLAKRAQRAHIRRAKESKKHAAKPVPVALAKKPGKKNKQKQAPKRARSAAVQPPVIPVKRVPEPEPVAAVPAPVVEKKPEVAVPVAESVALEATDSQAVELELTETTTQVMDLGLQNGPGQPSEGPLVLGTQEYEELQRYQEVHERVGKQWHPPVGLRAKKTCILLITVSAQGRVEQLASEQSSGVLAYDMAARMAAYKTQFPPCVWRQQVRLHF